MVRFRTLFALVLALTAIAVLPAFAFQDSSSIPAVPESLAALWAAGIGALTAIVFQVLKKAAAPIAKLPDYAKAIVAFVISMVSTKLGVFLGAPIPPDLAGFAGVVVSWATGMGLHALGKAVGVVPTAPTV